MFDAESGLIIWEILTFILFLVILRAYAWNPLMMVLNSREASIRRSIESAEQAKHDAEKMLQGGRESVLGFDRELDLVRERARVLADQIRRTLAESALKEVERILDENREEIGKAKKLAIHRLRAEIGGLIIESSASLIDTLLDPAGHRKLIDRVLENLPHDGVLKSEDAAARQEFN